MSKTVKELINELLEFPMDAEVVVEINGDKEYEIENSLSANYYRNRMLLQIEVPREEV